MKHPLAAMLTIGALVACQHMDFDEPGQEEGISSGKIEQPQHTGQGTVTSPYTITDFLGNDSTDGAVYWIIGYVVGSTSGSMGHASFSVPTDNRTSILLAAENTCRETSLCVPVELKSNTMREGYNLANHPEHLGHCILVRGTRGKYFSQPGLRNATEAQWFPLLDISEICPFPQDWEETDYDFLPPPHLAKQ